MRPIVDVAASLGIPRQHLTLFGDDKAKVALAALDSGRPRGKLILVSAITPTDAGEGKTTISIGLAPRACRGSGRKPASPSESHRLARRSG